MASLKKNNTLKFKKPASLWGAMWREGLPTGNGIIGASVLGGAGFESILINHNDLWWQGHTGVLPDISDKIKTVKTNINNGNYAEAEKVLPKALMVKSYRPQLSYPLPLCDLKVTMPIEKMVKEYYRAVNLDNGEVTVSFKDKNTRFERNLFVSRVNDLICYQISKSGQKTIDCTLRFDLHDKFNNRGPGGITQVNDDFEFAASKGYMTYSARSDNGTDYGVVARVINVGGSVTCTEDGIEVKGADKVTLFAKVYIDAQKDREEESIKKELSMIKLTYEKLLKEHSAIHNKLMNIGSLNLNAKQEVYIDELIDKTVNGELPIALLERLYAYGKYLFICSCKENGQPCNPYGIFNGDYKACDSTRNNFFQTQRLYNFAFNGGMSNLVLPLLQRYYNNMDDYKKNATRLYNCKGIYVPALESPGSGLLGSVEPGVILNFNVAAFASEMFYQYYIHTDDAKFMKDYGMEFIIETAEFYEDLLKVNKTTKILESPIGYSPYNTPQNYANKSKEPLCIASNCTVDFVCAKEVFNIIIEIGKTFGLDDSEIERWQDLLAKLPDITVDDEGLIKEYLSSVFITNNKTPYIPHLFPYSIGFTSSGATRDFSKLVANTAKARFSRSRDLFTSGNLINIASALATAGDSNSAYEVLEILTQNFLTNNLVFTNSDYRGMGVGSVDKWPTYSIDKNTGLVHVIQNMFVNYERGRIILFKNLPASFTKGSITGLTLPNGIKLDLEFNRAKGLLKFKIKTQKAQSLKVELPEGFSRVKGVPVENVDAENLCFTLNTQGGKAQQLVIRWANKI